jgi:hypothetical protein
MSGHCRRGSERLIIRGDDAPKYGSAARRRAAAIVRWEDQTCFAFLIVARADPHRFVQCTASATMSARFRVRISRAPIRFTQRVPRMACSSLVDFVLATRSSSPQQFGLSPYSIVTM